MVLKELIKKTKESIDPHDLIEREIGKTIKNKVCCPFHGEDTPSFHVYEDHYKCYGCGWRGDIIDLIAALHNFSTRQAVDYLSGTGIEPTRRPYDKPRRRTTDAPGLDPEVVTRCAAKMTPAHNAVWHEWRISTRSLQKFGVGWTGKRYLFPWYYRGALVAAKLRRCEVHTPELEPKYISLKGSRFIAPFNIDRVFSDRPDVLLIVEAEKDVLAAARLGLVAISVPANGFKKEWAEMLYGVLRVIAICDNDEGGERNADHLNKTLRRAEIVYPPNRYASDGTFIKDFSDAYKYHNEIGLDWLASILGYAV
jgi:DNA primase